MTTTPIALFAYNRPDHLRRTLTSLRANQVPLLYVFSDGPRTATAEPAVAEVRRILRGIDWCETCLTEHETNLGLARSIVSGVTEVCHRHGRVVVVEDDLVTSPYFYRYLTDALDLYENDDEVIGVHGYVYPVDEPIPETFFLRGADCWGWATWQRGWKLFNPDGAALLAALERQGLQHTFDLDGAFPFTQMLRDQIAGRNDSWAIRWHASAFLAGKLTLYPGRSLVHNIGTDASGTHGVSTQRFDAAVTSIPVFPRRIPLVENAAARQAIIRYLRRTRAPRHANPLRWLKSRLAPR